MAGDLHLPRRDFGSTGLKVTSLALAAWSVRASGPGGISLKPEDVERAYYEYGINTFHVSWQMKSMAEGVRRLIKAGHRNDLVLITEVGIPTGLFVRRGWERNARALGVDCIDVFLLGWVQAQWYVTGRTWPTMRALKEKGKVRAIGFSCHNRIMATKLGRELRVDTLMIRYNAAHRGAEREVFEPLGQERPAIIAYTATRWGMLLKPVPKLGFPQPMDGGECYRFVLGNPAVDTVLCAARTPDELRHDVAAALKGPLDPARDQEVRKFGDAVHAAARGGRRWMFRQG